MFIFEPKDFVVFEKKVRAGGGDLRNRVGDDGNRTGEKSEKVGFSSSLNDPVKRYQKCGTK